MKSPLVLSAAQVCVFQKRIKDHYEKFGRELPWRKTRDPYKILVSEVMLQQTQVARVVDKYETFIARFPDIVSLARAPLHEILSEWQGMGYNRRALALKKLAEKIVAECEAQIPSHVEILIELPGIGNATAHAVCAFAFNKPVVFIETNIRTVFIHRFFKERDEVKDAEILPLVAQTLDRNDARTWYWAVMDYGVYLKKRYANPGRGSAHYKRQSPFKGSNREIRGMILRMLLKRPRISEKILFREMPLPADAVRYNLGQLENEGLIVRKGSFFSVA